MLTGATPSAGPNVTAAAQVFKQSNVIVGPGVGVNDPVAFASGPTNLGQQLGVPVLGATWIRVQVFHYGRYDDSIAVWQARPYIAWRVVGFVPSARPTILPNVLGNIGQVPMSTPQTTTVNQPVTLQIWAGGLYRVSVAFDATGGVPAADQGYDRFLVSISAGS